MPGIDLLGIFSVRTVPDARQGRIAADVIAGRDSKYRGTQGRLRLRC